MYRLPVYLVWLSLSASCASPQKDHKEEESREEFSVIAYYSGNAEAIDSFPADQLTHIIFSFCHLKGNRLSVDNAADTATIRKLVSLKSRHPQLKILLSLGGWGGCEFCSPVFAADSGRREFASSVRQLADHFKTDGIDIDWEYPAIEGHPGHAYSPADKPNFSALIRTLRDSLGAKQEICFAAGGFIRYLAEAVDWKEVMPLVDKVNLMTYDLVSGFSTVTGHHTPLYAAPGVKESADKTIRYLDSIGVPKNKLVIGAAFYARTWENVANVNNGLFQSGKFKNFIGYDNFHQHFGPGSGFIVYEDSAAKASWAYNAEKKTFATFDDSISVAAKTNYALVQGLNGIMFWELSLDKPRQGLVRVIADQVGRIKSNKVPR